MSRSKRSKKAANRKKHRAKSMLPEVTSSGANFFDPQTDSQQAIVKNSLWLVNRKRILPQIQEALLQIVPVGPNILMREGVC